MTAKINGTSGFTAPDGSVRSSFGRTKIQDQQNPGVLGGASIAGTQTRNLNTMPVNDLGVTLSGNAFTLQPGTYWSTASCPAFNVGVHAAWIATAAAPTVPADPSLFGGGEYSYSTGAAPTTVSNTRISGRLVVTTATSYVLRHYTQLAVASQGLGTAANIGAPFNEVYAVVLIEKEK